MPKQEPLKQTACTTHTQNALAHPDRTCVSDDGRGSVHLKPALDGLSLTYDAHKNRTALRVQGWRATASVVAGVAAVAIAWILARH